MLRGEHPARRQREEPAGKLLPVQGADQHGEGRGGARRGHRENQARGSRGSTLKRDRAAIAVSDERGVRMLHVGGEAIQSAMRVAEPDALALDYTRCMMGFLLFHPEPREALMIGLGGGSLAKFFHRRLRATRLRVVELDARIVVAARTHFGLPANDARLAVEIGDGAAALAPECCDALVIDAFQDEQHVPQLASAEFYDGAFLALAEPGVMVVNFMDDDPKFDQALQRLERAFGGAVLPERLESRLGLPFTRYVSRLRAMNCGTPRDLIIGA